MKTRILLLTSFLVLGAGCGNKGKTGDDKTAAPPIVDQVGREHRADDTLAFLDQSHYMDKIVRTRTTDPRIVSARLTTDSGYRGSDYSLKVVVRNNYGVSQVVRLKGQLIPTPDMRAIVLRNVFGPSGVLNAYRNQTSQAQCALISIQLPNVGQTSFLVCEDDDNDRYDRDGRRDRRRY